MAEKKLLILTLKPSMEEVISDWLIDYDPKMGFTSLPVSGHGSRMKGLSIAEQVSGRKKQVQFKIMLDGEAVEPLMASLRDSFSNSGINYWLLPVERSGLI